MKPLFEAHRQPELAIEAFNEVSRAIRTQGIDAVVKTICAMDADIDVRKRAALFVVGLRGHEVGAREVSEQGFGIVITCRACKRSIIAPRHVQRGEFIYGTGTEAECSARRASSS